LQNLSKKTMNNQKDTQKTGINSYGHTDVSSSNSLVNKPALPAGGPIYEFANKKTEKLVTALYMVTDCMDADDALKSKLRLLGVELLSDIYKISTLSPIDKGIHISITLSRITELLSFIDIACTIGFISEMNSAILNREFKNLISELRSYQSKDTHFTFTLNDNMFEVERPFNNPQAIKDSIKDKSNNKGHLLKKTYSTFPYINKAPSLSNGFTKDNYNIIDKYDRSDKILSFIKNLPNNQTGVSIKDVSIAFTDCSEKTIQRELNSLVLKGSLKKIGAKRWSRYQAL